MTSKMETFSALLAFSAGNSPVTDEFHTQRPMTRRFDVFFDLRLNQHLRKQWFDTPLRKTTTYVAVNDETFLISVAAWGAVPISLLL